MCGAISPHTHTSIRFHDVNRDFKCTYLSMKANTSRASFTMPAMQLLIYFLIYTAPIANYSQQDATFFEFIYFYRRSTCFRRFLRPSSGVHNCTYSFRYCQPILLLAATSTVAASSSSFNIF